jgi:hypothetical protein
VRFKGWFCLALGAVFLFAAGVFGILAIRQATEISAYRHARACPAGAPSNGDCLQAVDGSVAGVTEFQGSGKVGADYALDVRTASTTLHLTFSSDSPMLAEALDGDPAVVTTWRGVAVSVVTDGRSEVTTSVPETALAGDLGDSEVFGGVGAFFVLGAMAIRRNRRAGGTRPLTRPVSGAALMALGLGGTAVLIGGVALGGKPSRLGPDLAATGGALVAVLGLSVWHGISVRGRASESTASPARAQGMANQTRMHPATWARVLGPRAAAYLPMLLTVGVLFGVFLTSQDGPAARAFRYAPACVGGTNIATCVGDFTAVINGVRGPTNGDEITYVSYVTLDGAINTWARFDGNPATIARKATADERARSQLRIRVWRRSIVGAELGGSWHWADGNPPANTIPTVFLAVSFVLLMLVVRLRIHRRAGAVADSQRLVTDDLGQAAAAAGSIILLGYGFWAGAILAVAVLLWLGLSVRRSAQFRRLTLAALHSS